MAKPQYKWQVLTLSGENMLMGISRILERELTAQEIDLALGLALRIVEDEGLAAARAALDLTAKLPGMSVEILYTNLVHGITGVRFESGDMAMEVSWAGIQLMPCVCHPEELL